MLSEEDLRVPRFVKIPEEKPFSENRKDKFYAVKLEEWENGVSRRFRGERYPQPGYNSKSNTTKIARINTESLDYTVTRN